MLTYFTIEQSLAKLVKETVTAIARADLAEVRLTEPPSPEMGDVSFACFEVAKAVKKNSAEVARELVEIIAPSEIIKEARAVRGRDGVSR